jgi:hypothetical protein
VAPGDSFGDQELRLCNRNYQELSEVRSERGEVLLAPKGFDVKL